MKTATLMLNQIYRSAVSSFILLMFSSSTLFAGDVIAIDPTTQQPVKSFVATETVPANTPEQIPTGSLVQAPALMAASRVVEVRPGESVQTAINSAQEGDIIRIYAGTYKNLTNSSVLILRVNNVTIEGVPDAAGNRPVVEGTHWDLSEGSTMKNIVLGRFPSSTVDPYIKVKNNVTVENVKGFILSGTANFVKILSSEFNSGRGTDHGGYEIGIIGNSNQILNTRVTGYGSVIRIIGNDNVLSGNTFHAQDGQDTILCDRWMNGTCYGYQGIGVSDEPVVVLQGLNNALSQSTVVGYGSRGVNSSGILIGGGTLNKITNTIIANTGAAIDARVPVQVSYSLLQNYSAHPNIFEGPGNLKNVDPQFVNLTARDFHLKDSSPAINAGDPNAAQDPDGTRADIGAFYNNQLGPNGSVKTASNPNFYYGLERNNTSSPYRLMLYKKEANGTFTSQILQSGSYNLYAYNHKVDVSPDGQYVIFAQRDPVNVYFSGISRFGHWDEKVYVQKLGTTQKLTITETDSSAFHINEQIINSIQFEGNTATIVTSQATYLVDLTTLKIIPPAVLPAGAVQTASNANFYYNLERDGIYSPYRLVLYKREANGSLTSQILESGSYNLYAYNHKVDVSPDGQYVIFAQRDPVNVYFNGISRFGHWDEKVYVQKLGTTQKLTITETDSSAFHIDEAIIKSIQFQGTTATIAMSQATYTVNLTTLAITGYVLSSTVPAKNNANFEFKVATESSSAGYHNYLDVTNKTTGVTTRLFDENTLTAPGVGFTDGYVSADGKTVVYQIKTGIFIKNLETSGPALSLLTITGVANPLSLGQLTNVQFPAGEIVIATSTLPETRLKLTGTHYATTIETTPTQEKLKLLDLNTGAVQILAVNNFSTGKRLVNRVLISPDTTPGGAMVVYAITQPAVPGMMNVEVTLQRIGNPAQFYRNNLQIMTAADPLGTLELKPDGTLVHRVTTPLAGGGTRTFSYSYSPNAAGQIVLGSYTVASEGIPSKNNMNFTFTEVTEALGTGYRNYLDIVNKTTGAVTRLYENTGNVPGVGFTGGYVSPDGKNVVYQIFSSEIVIRSLAEPAKSVRLLDVAGVANPSELGTLISVQFTDATHIVVNTTKFAGLQVTLVLVMPSVKLAPKVTYTFATAEQAHDFLRSQNVRGLSKGELEALKFPVAANQTLTGNFLVTVFDKDTAEVSYSGQILTNSCIGTSCQVSTQSYSKTLLKSPNYPNGITIQKAAKIVKVGFTLDGKLVLQAENGSYTIYNFDGSVYAYAKNIG